MFSFFKKKAPAPPPAAPAEVVADRPSPPRHRRRRPRRHLHRTRASIAPATAPAPADPAEGPASAASAPGSPWPPTHAGAASGAGAGAASVAPRRAARRSGHRGDGARRAARCHAAQAAGRYDIVPPARCRRRAAAAASIAVEPRSSWLGRLRQGLRKTGVGHHAGLHRRAHRRCDVRRSRGRAAAGRHAAAGDRIPARRAEAAGQGARRDDADVAVKTLLATR